MTSIKGLYENTQMDHCVLPVTQSVDLSMALLPVMARVQNIVQSAEASRMVSPVWITVPVV